MENGSITPTPTRPVMDIRPQRSAPQPIQRATVTGDQPRPVQTPPAEPTQPTSVVPAPQTEAPKEDLKDFTPPPLAEMKLPPKSKAPVAAIIVALLVSGALIGLTVFAYLKTKDGTKASNTTASQQADTVTPEDVDASVKAVEDELNTANDDTDFNSSELSDESLGL